MLELCLINKVIRINGGCWLYVRKVEDIHYIMHDLNLSKCVCLTCDKCRENYQKQI